jgi:hypothetical protein
VTVGGSQTRGVSATIPDMWTSSPQSSSNVECECLFLSILSTRLTNFALAFFAPFRALIVAVEVGRHILKILLIVDSFGMLDWDLRMDLGREVVEDGGEGGYTSVGQ